MLNILTFGSPSDANVKAEGLRFFGKMRYDIAGVMVMLKGGDREAVVTMDGKVMDENFNFIIVSGWSSSLVSISLSLYSYAFSLVWCLLCWWCTLSHPSHILCFMFHFFFSTPYRSKTTSTVVLSCDSARSRAWMMVSLTASCSLMPAVVSSSPSLTS